MEAADKLAIHEVLSRAAFGLDEQDLGIIEKCFSADASMLLHIAGHDDVGPFEGRDAIMKLMADSIAVQTDIRRHTISNIFFESGGDDAATVISTLTLFATEDGVIKPLTAGVYRDKMIKLDGGWFIADRDLVLDLPY